MKLKRSILAGAVALGLALGGVAYAQVMQYLNGSGQPTAVTSSNPLPSSVVGTATVALNAQGQFPTTTTTSALSFSIGLGIYITQGTTAGFLVLISGMTIPGSGSAIVPVMCLPVAANGYAAFSSPAGYTLYNNGTGMTLLDSTSCTTYTPTTPIVMGVI